MEFEFEYKECIITVEADVRIYTDEGTYDTPGYTEADWTVESVMITDEDNNTEELEYNKIAEDLKDLIDQEIEERI